MYSIRRGGAAHESMELEKSRRGRYGTQSARSCDRAGGQVALLHRGDSMVMFSGLWDIAWDTKPASNAEAARQQTRDRDCPPPLGGTPQAILRDDLARHPTGL